MSKKVIEQERFDELTVAPLTGGVQVYQQTDRQNISCIVIENQFRTTVAKAIDPEYQKVEDENKILKDELETERFNHHYFENKLSKAVEHIKKDTATIKDLEQRNAKLVEALEELPQLIHDALGSRENEYTVKDLPENSCVDDGDFWITHNEVGSGEPFKQFIQSVINQALQNTKNIEG